MTTVRPERVAALGLLALVPVGAFLAGRSVLAALSVACVGVVAASLYRLFGPAESAGADAGGH